MISANNVTLRVGKKALFEDVNIKFTEGNCYGMIGANGAGKSTFLKILSGQLEPTQGDVVITPGERLSFLQQDHFKYDEFPVLDTVIMGNERLFQIMKEKDELYAKEEFTDADGERASELEGEFAELDGWNAESNAEMILTGLGISLDLEHKQMNELDISADPSINTEGLDFVLEGSRFDILENKVTLCVPDGVENGVTSFDDMAQKLKDGSILLAMGNSDVPVGQYTQKILAYYDLDETALAGAGAITYCTNVKEVTTQVSEGSVDCGVIYCTDAFSAGLTPVAYATAEMCGQVIYPAAVLSVSQHPTEAQAFLDYLSTPEAMAVFEAVGFAAA